jgi:hypothetical protein
MFRQQALMLDEDEYFSLSANVETPGEIRMTLSGYLVQQRSDGTYIAPLIPQLFYGADGTQLQTWRQDITQAGEQVILSRSGGQPEVPREELFWRKVAEPKAEVTEVAKVTQVQTPNAGPILLLGLILLLVLGTR